MSHDEHYTQTAGQNLSTAKEKTVSKWKSVSRTPQRSAAPATMRRPIEQRSLKNCPCNWSTIQGFAVMPANDATGNMPSPKAAETGASCKQSATHFGDGLHVQN